MLKVWGAAIALMLAVAPCYADDSDTDRALQALVMIATPRDAIKDDHQCTMTETVDYTRYLSEIETFRNGGVLSKDYSVDWFANHGKQVLSVVLMKFLAYVVTRATYDDENAPKTDCHFAIYVSYPDNMGHDQTVKVVTWAFTNDMAKEMNWDKANPAHFDSVAKDYIFTPEAEVWASDEPSIADH